MAGSKSKPSSIVQTHKHVYIKCFTSTKLTFPACLVAESTGLGAVVLSIHTAVVACFRGNRDDGTIHMDVGSG